MNGNAPSQHSRASSVASDQKYKRREVSHMRNERQKRKNARLSRNADDEVFKKLNMLPEKPDCPEGNDSFSSDNQTTCLVKDSKVQENKQISNIDPDETNYQETTVIGYSERDIMNNNLSITSSDQMVSSGDAAAEADDEGAN